MGIEPFGAVRHGFAGCPTMNLIRTPSLRIRGKLSIAEELYVSTLVDGFHDRSTGNWPAFPDLERR
jgi:hypothetical protein